MLQKGLGADVLRQRQARERRPPMSGIQHRPVLAGYRDTVTELLKTGEPFADVEQAIDEIGDLNQEQKAALWLFAFSLRDPGEQRRDAMAHLAFVQ
jgi:hypothetical protein